MSTGEGRAIPFHCPFCGETDLWPHEVVATDPDSGASEVSSPHGSWECRSCLRAFQIKSLGLVNREVTR